MKITIPTIDDLGLESQVSGHFGQANFFVTVDTETKDVEVTTNTGEHHGGGRTPAQIVAEAGGQVVLCGGLGRRAVRVFQEAGVAVFMGAQGTVESALQAYDMGKLEEATEAGACPGHE